MTKQHSNRKNSFKVTLSVFSGEEKEYVRKSEPKAKVMLAAIGLFVILIFAGCMLSAYFFFDSLMQGKNAISLPIGIFWGLLVVNMYLLLLYTVSPTILPHKKNKAGFDNGLFTFSMFLRVGFMCLLAAIISQPLNVELFSKSVSASLARHVQEEKAAMIISSDAFIVSQEMKDYKNFESQAKLLPGQQGLDLAPEIVAIKGKIKTDSIFVKEAARKLEKLLSIEKKLIASKKEKHLQQQLLTELSGMIDSEIRSDHQLAELLKDKKNLHPQFVEYREQLLLALNTKLKNYDDLDKLLSASNFYIKKVQLIFYENPLSWLVTGGICFLFIVPIILKYKVRKYTNYYQERIEMEKKDVEDRYNEFKSRYSNILRSNISKYNFSSLTRLKAELQKIKRFDERLYKKLKKEIEAEYKDEVFSKYEFWADNPFRTQPKSKPRLKTQPPIALMDFVYGDSQNDD